MLAQDVRSLDVVLSTVEVAELIDTEKDYFNSIVVDESEAINWQADDLISARLSSGLPLDSSSLKSLKPYTLQSFKFFTPSEMQYTSTSNNYVNQLFIKSVYDKTGKIVHETDIKESLRRNKKGFTVKLDKA